jgi:hypothetical protein
MPDLTAQSASLCMLELHFGTDLVLLAMVLGTLLCIPT